MNIIKRKVDKFTMHLCPSDGGISSALINAGGREAVFMHLIKENIHDGDICLDLGANIGYATLFMADKCGPSGKVYAVEPDPHNLNLLKLNIEENNFHEICQVGQCLISDTDGEQDFWLANAPNLNSVKRTHNSIKKILVNSLSLPSYLKDKDCPNFIKMDVEGHEAPILSGALDYFCDHHVNIKILIEVHPQFYDSDNDFEKVLADYFNNGFNTKHVVSTPVPQPRLFKESGYFPSSSFHTDGFHRGLYNGIRNEDTLRFACRKNTEGASQKIVRSIMIEKAPVSL